MTCAATPGVKTSDTNTGFLGHSYSAPNRFRRLTFLMSEVSPGVRSGDGVPRSARCCLTVRDVARRFALLPT